MSYLIAAGLGYLLGSSNMAYYIAKWKKADLSAAGSGNLGASNATILLGWWAGVLVFLHDAGKAVLAVLIARALFPQAEFIGAVAGIAGVLGHIFPFYLKFKGGKGFAAYLGMTIALDWKLFLIIGVAIVVVTLITDYIVCGTFATILTVPIYTGITSRSFLAACILLIGTAVIFYKHRENIPRMLNGTEIGLRSTIRGDNKLKKGK